MQNRQIRFVRSCISSSLSSINGSAIVHFKEAATIRELEYEALLPGNDRSDLNVDEPDEDRKKDLQNADVIIPGTRIKRG